MTTGIVRFRPAVTLPVPEASVILDVPVLFDLALSRDPAGQVHVSALAIHEVTRHAGRIGARVTVSFRMTPEGEPITDSRYVLIPLRQDQTADDRRLAIVRRAIALTILDRVEGAAARKMAA